jgi:hypothetical protein
LVAVGEAQVSVREFAARQKTEMEVREGTKKGEGAKKVKKKRERKRNGKNIDTQDILPSAFALTVYIQFSLIISFSVINSRAMGSALTNHGDGHIGINSVKD